LTLCEKLVTLHGGQIGVDSQEGRGALFWFEIPLEAAQSADPLVDLIDDNLSDEPLSILVVDDNNVNLMVAQLQLQKCWPKAQITTVDSGAKALSLIDQQLFDVALIDMVMPEMDGMQVTRQIRQQFPAIAARMPILALTANTNPVDRERCLAAGMNDVLHKPMEMAALMRAVGHNIALARKGGA
jgi:CheY-like chemotaxis protein